MTAYNAFDLTGQKFGRWLVLGLVEPRHGKSAFMCRCRCGIERVVVGQSLRRGKSTSCGCERGASYTLQGQTAAGEKRPEYSSWMGMRMRCNDPHRLHFERYGGRGIRVCERWDKSFAAFLEDMGPMPERRMTIERIDNDGNYEPGNCKWATRKEQAQNRTYNIKWEHRTRDLAGRFN